MPETRTSFVHRYLGSLICKNPRMLLLSAAVVQGLLLGAQEPSSPAAKPVLTTQRTWTLSYQNCRVPQGNEVRTPDGFTYMPVPDSPDGSVRAKKVDLIGVMDRRQRRVEGIQLELFRVATERRFSLSLEVEVDVLDYRKMLKSSSFPGSWPKELWEFLGPSETRFYQKKNLLRIDPKSPTVRKAATGLRRDTPLETAQAVLDWLKKNLRYEGVEHYSVDEVIQRGFGECGAYSAAFTALARSCGLPARDVWGLTDLPDVQKTERQLAGHAWAEVYFPGIGWVQVEPQHPETLGLIPSHYIRFCHFAPRSSAFPWHSIPNESFIVFAGRHPEYRMIERPVPRGR